jgi:hypothetical protein
VIDLQPFAFEYVRFADRVGASVGGLDGVENLLTVVLLSVSVALALMSGRRLASAWVFCGAMLVSLFLVRLPMFLPLLRDPDEAQVLSGARRLLHDPVFWRSVDGATNGPLNHYLLLSMRLVGLPLNLATARFANVLTWWGAIVFLYLTARLVLPEWAARLSVLPALLAAMQFRYDEFIQYSSEALPVLLIACAVWLLARCYLAATSKPWTWLSLGLVLASLPFSKLQALPIAAILGAAALASVYITDPKIGKRKAVLWLVAGGLLVLLSLLAFLAGFGLFHDFYESYVVSNLSYTNQAVVHWSPASFFDFVFQYPEVSRYLSWMAAFVGVAVLYGLWQKERRPSAAVWLAVGLLAASVYAVYRPGRSFQHYLLFLFFPVNLAAILGLASILRRSGRSVACGAVFSALTLAIPAFLGATGTGNSMGPFTGAPKKIVSSASRRLNELAEPGAPMVVWGWEPALYLLTDTVPGVRDLQTGKEIEVGPQREYYRRRFLHDLTAEPPQVFADAVGPGRFGYQDRATEGYESMPELREYIDAHYDLTDDLQNIRLFARRGSVTAPPEKPVMPPVAIRCGGDAVQDPDGRQWGRDAFFYGGAALAVPPNGGLNLSPIYLAERSCRQSCEYVIPVPNGTYLVKIHFIELSYAAPGARVFDVVVDNSPVLSGFDIFREAGVGRPLDREAETVATHGRITIGLLPKIAEAKINAIEILPRVRP